MDIYAIRSKCIKLSKEFLVLSSLKTQSILYKLLISLQIPKTFVNVTTFMFDEEESKDMFC